MAYLPKRKRGDKPEQTLAKLAFAIKYAHEYNTEEIADLLLALVEHIAKG